eukprot:916316-Pelagomonas_calceolata.AAC.3
MGSPRASLREHVLRIAAFIAFHASLLLFIAPSPLYLLLLAAATAAALQDFGVKNDYHVGVPSRAQPPAPPVAGAGSPAGGQAAHQ